MKLYADPTSVNSRKVFAGLELMDVGYEYVFVDHLAQANKKAEYLAINPNGTIPTLVDGAFVLWESNAILDYVADKNNADRYYPCDPELRADIHRWQFWEIGHWFPSCYIYLIENIGKPLLHKLEPDLAVLEKEAPNWNKLAGILESRLSENKWICGDTVTIADLSIAAPIHLHPWQGLPWAPYPNLRRWMLDCVEDLDCWKNSDPTKILGLTDGK